MALDPASRPTILVVDDTPGNLTLLNSFLKESYRVLLANSGAKALQLAKTTPPDLVLLDIMMPEMDGQEVLKRIRTMEEVEGVMPGNGVKVIMTTCLNDKKNVFTAFNEQCDAYLVKPIDKAKMLDHLHEFGLI